MTSGVFRSLEISSIIIDRESRQRKDLPDLPALARSIEAKGLINPILVQRDTMTLIAGERRLEACKSLGWTHIAAQFEDEAEEAALRSLELEENIRRVDLPWQDQCLAIWEYHKIQASKDSAWTQVKSAIALNMSEPDLTRKMNVARELVGGNVRVAAAPKLSTAVGITQRAQERATQAVTEKLKFITPVAEIEKSPESILVVDFNEWAKIYEGPRFNFIHCDFPYGIGADKFNMGFGGGSHLVHGNYEDSFESYEKLLATLIEHISTLSTDSTHIIFWFSMKHYQFTFDYLSRVFEINPFPLFWHKSDGAGVCPDPQRGPFRIYETAFFGSRGDRKIVRAKHNSYSSPSTRAIHMSTKSQSMLQYFFEMFVDQNTRMLDPTCGSGGALRAAEACGAGYVLGLEKNQEFAENARIELEKSRRLRKVSA